MLSRNKLRQLLSSELKKQNTDLVTEKELDLFLSDYSGSDRIVRFNDVPTQKLEPIKTGFRGIDSLIRGFYPQQVITLTAFPKHGKTSFTLDITRNIGEDKCLFLSLEQSPTDLKTQWNEKGHSIPNVYTALDTDEVLTHTDWIEFKIVETQYHSKKETGQPIQAVFIDHFGYIDWRKEAGENQADAIRRVMHELKRIARRTNTFIVVIVHVNKEDQTNPPQTQDLQGSSGYHQVSDTIISLWRETYTENKKTVKTNNVLMQVVANRRWGDEGYAKYVFVNSKYIEEEWTSYEQMMARHNKKQDEDYLQIIKN